MKKVSIIVPVYNSEKYLKLCLDSLVNQTLKDIEIVIINDGSSDNSEKIIKEYQDKYSDKIIYQKQKNGGVASARNKALKLASGEYIGFVDSDDFVALDMYEKLYTKAETNKADIVISGYFFDYPDGTCRNYELDEMSHFSKSLHESPSILLNTTPFITNKIFKRSFLEKNNYYFEKYRIFEDLLFTYKAFLKANKINKVNECFYHYCRRKGESVTGGFSNKFEDIYEVGNKLRKYYIDNNGKDLLEYIDYIIIKHIYLRFNAKVGIKEIQYKHSFIRKSIKYLNKNIPNWKNNIYFEIYKDRTTSGIVSIIRPYKNKIKNILKKIIKKINSPGHTYQKYYNKKVNNKTVYLYSQKGNDINGNIFYILKELRDNKKYDDYTIYIPVKKNRVEEFKKKLNNYNINNYNLIIDNTKKNAKALANSKYIFTDTSLELFYVKKPGQIYVNTWHGTPLKTLGKSVATDYYSISNIQKNFNLADYLLYPNEYMKEIMIRDYMLNVKENKICMLGYPRNSVFFKKQGKTNKKRIAYLPTWRGSNLGKNSLSYLEELKKILHELDEKLTEEYEFFINLHPYLKGKIDFSSYKNIKTIDSKYETYDFLSTCDILITDYSSVFFDFACTKRKIILFTYDKEEYLNDRGMYYDIEKLPFPMANTIEELIKEIKKPYKFDYQNFINEFCNYDSINNTKKLIDLVFDNKKDNTLIETNKNITKNNVLFHSNNFIRSNELNETLEVIKELSKNNTVYLSFLNSKIKRNKYILRQQDRKYYGYFGNFTLNNFFQYIMIKLLEKKENLYNLFPNFYDRIFKFEYLRRYQDINFSKIILYNEKDKLNIYTFAYSKCKKIIYLKNSNLNISLLNKYDLIYVKNNKELEKLIKKGIKKEKVKITDMDVKNNEK